MRPAASRTFCTAGRRRPIRMAIIAITTSSSMRVNARRARSHGRMTASSKTRGNDGRVATRAHSLAERTDTKRSGELHGERRGGLSVAEQTQILFETESHQVDVDCNSSRKAVKGLADKSRPGRQGGCRK